MEKSKKKFIIVHGFASSPKLYWFPWIKKELEMLGFEALAPQMPNSLKPRIEEWIPFLSKVVGTPDENTYFIGHSIGCQTIIRYLESLPEGARVGGAFFVAPFIVLPDLEKEIVKQWIERKIDFEKVKKIIPSSTSIFSDDDPLIPIENKNHFENLLKSKVLVLKGLNHFVTVTRLPVLLEEIKKSL